jgi:hypothetical protein
VSGSSKKSGLDWGKPAIEAFVKRNNKIISGNLVITKFGGLIARFGTTRVFMMFVFLGKKIERLEKGFGLFGIKLNKNY